MNWNKSATGMEADGVVEGFMKSVEMHNLKFNKLIGTYCAFFIVYRVQDIVLKMFVGFKF